ncbi:uroporphyrinogen-III synthase [Alkalihalobacillus alcalophilus ATCC 27647 = CGMCC 1.3604]|uniref:Uroporphyrinogen-III synthase n=1 Tax=Alkalihalobacillus alcalophilus ATCC 27647 = CGMCC 1.3604 TaxID=1218173 RepID=A0A094WRQ0_ALKAL|nr:uroporphyrinogen-III synthase [Alkalihalobacillus alcalophilus]KGA98713.1 uroporphyrinogen-III synthase [Alkalihalobacillus alcalophilus ATCC 27647 = CGMCC 1.3604]MED1560340.1 uroporphyrinogen-III synthase [Alkalihalobacillus alcalophilus]THG89786.1 uroporphyrinogen-III synthase [Alkalihalobacillus alcalophilus ATCC 27647 = CGMCC 1.3604]
MSKPLAGKKVILTASRKTEEMKALVKKQGGEASVRSLQGTVFFAVDQLEKDLSAFIQQDVDWLILTTGIGTNALVEVAEKLGQKELFLQKMKKVKIAARGYKTIAALHKLGIKAEVVDDDGTTSGLISALRDTSFLNQNAWVQLHGLSSPTLIEFLENKGATVAQVLPYQHIAPEAETVELLLNEILTSQVDAVCFTTFLQVRSLFDYAKRHDKHRLLLEAFEKHVVAVAVGKVTKEELTVSGVERIVVPTLERMGAMIIELARYIKKQNNPTIH